MLAMMSNYWQIPLLTILFVMLPNSTHDESRTADRVRPATQAGRFYEADPSELMKELDACFGRHGDTAASDDIAALVVPHAGYYFSANVAASAFAMLRPEHRYQRIFLLGPSPYAWLNGPLARQLGVDCGQGMISESTNKALGRFIDLMMLNLGG